MSARRLFLGVDGGGTKTEFVCIDADGAVAGRARTGTTYHPQVGLDGAVAALREGIGAACAQAGTAPADLGYAFVGLPAFGEDSHVDPLLVAACGAIFGHDRYACDNDMVCGWAGSLDCEDGINLVAGTGSIAYGVRRGIGARAGGWGEVFGDEGSAYWIATRGLDLFARMSDGRAPIGPLHAAIRERFELADDLDLLRHVMGDAGIGRGEIASLATTIVAAAQQGDEAAGAVLRQAGIELAGLATALRGRLGYQAHDTVLLSWSGGILENVAETRSAFGTAVEESGQWRLIPPRHSPAIGAARYAARLGMKDAHLESRAG